MRINKDCKKGFSLTELIIVLVIIALLFAALAPIITKRHIAESGGSEAIWNFVSNDPERNSYFNPAVPDWTSSVYVGMTPPATQDKHSGKLVINSGSITYNNATYLQPQLQFRFSPNENELTNGIDAGSLLVGTNDNLYLGNIHNFSGTKNSILGFSNLVGATNLGNSVVVGFGAMKNGSNLNSANVQYIAIGTNAGHSVTFPSGGIYIGSLAGLNDANISNIAIGYHAWFNNSSIDNAGENIAIGAQTGILQNTISDVAMNNIFIGTLSTPASIEHNIDHTTIIGRGSYTPAGDNIPTNGVSEMTAIGYHACNGINSPDKTICLGYETGSEVNNSFEYQNSENEHILLGGIPQGGFGGRGVVEVHNYGSGPSATNADVIFNSNLVVRGKLYAANSDDTQPRNYKLSATNTAGYDPVTSYRCTSDEKKHILLVYNTYVCTDGFSDILSESETSSANPARYRNMLKSDGYVPNSVMSSDVRLKTNIVENNDGIEKILKLDPYNYTFKQDILATSQVGVIAQDLEKVFPTSVSEDSKGFLKIRWDEMFYAMINSIKQLSLKVEILSEKIVTLAKNIDFVKFQQKELRKKLVTLDNRVKKLERK